MILSDFLAPISKRELHEAYFIDMSHCKSFLRDLKNEYTTFTINDPERVGGSNRVTYAVKFYFVNHDPVLDEALQRWLFDNKQCLSQPGVRAKVAYRLRFYCRTPFQRGGLATQLLLREEGVFKKWGAREIQLLAMDAGRWVWTRPKFGYQIADFDMHSLRQQYLDWQRSQKMTSILIAASLDDFPRAFLESAVNSLCLYKII